jgi:hypothetical protein
MFELTQALRTNLTRADIVQKYQCSLSPVVLSTRTFRLMNGGGDDDFSTTDNFNEFVNNVDNNNSRKTIPMPTMHQIIRNETRSSNSRRCCAFGDSTSMSEMLEHVRRSLACLLIFVSCAHESHFSAIDVESAFRSAIGWSSTKCGTSRSISIGTSSGSICTRILRASFYCCNWCNFAADVRTHILPITSDSSHSQLQ